MRLIQVGALDGIPPALERDLFNLMRKCSNGQRLVVCLYLMSELPDARHHLRDIEQALRRMFPPSLRSNLEAVDYQDFQASVVRFFFNTETKLVKEGRLALSNRLWASPMRGHWRNTELGNRVALQLLREKGWLLQKGTLIVNAVDEVLPDVKREYMEEELVSKVEAQDYLEPVATAGHCDENLLAHVDRILTVLPTLDLEHVPSEAGASVSAAGSPVAVLAVVRRLADALTTSRVRLVLTLDRDGYGVEISAECAPRVRVGP